MQPFKSRTEEKLQKESVISKTNSPKSLYCKVIHERFYLDPPFMQATFDLRHENAPSYLLMKLNFLLFKMMHGARIKL